jgi:predicted Zn-dependent protease
MKRFDLVVGSALALLGVFVTREALTTRALSGAERNASFGTARIDTTVAATDSVPVARRVVVAPAKVTSTADLRRRIAQASEDTYINDVIASHDSALARWPDRYGNPLRVWVQPSTTHSGFNPAAVPVVRQAFVEWSKLGIPVPFTFVVDSSMADVRVTRVEKFNESISGKTLWAHDDGWWIIDANIQLAVRHHSGELLDTTSVRAIAMHEVGHLLGLAHTTDTTSIMAPKVRVRDLSAADRATAQLLYRLPAGRLAEGPAPRKQR